ncbi:hypothetical protein [Pseudomonas sp. BBP2017]|uniref:hypothetical protein n=1 Tax=Pseudomonas sp. BBP2017 TaxID=2109731 RepID=UPI0011B279F4|nr:hypothetical protein [Pseudomonas sp. BBP2017]
MKKGAMVPFLVSAGKSFLTLRTALAPESCEWLRLPVAPFCSEVVRGVLPQENFGATGHL